MIQIRPLICFDWFTVVTPPRCPMSTYLKSDCDLYEYYSVSFVCRQATSGTLGVCGITKCQIHCQNIYCKCVFTMSTILKCLLTDLKTVVKGDQHREFLIKKYFFVFLQKNCHHVPKYYKASSARNSKKQVEREGGRVLKFFGFFFLQLMKKLFD